MTQQWETERTSTGVAGRHGDGDQTEVQSLLEQMARALTAGDGRTVARMWETPAMVISDQGVQAVASTSEVEQFFSGAKDQYNKMGIVDTRPEIQQLTWATRRIAIAEVRWPWLDGSGRESGSETSTYTFRRDDSGQLKVRAVVMHGVARND